MNEREIEINNAISLVINILKDFRLTLTIKPLLDKKYKNNPIYTLIIIDEITGKEYVITKELENE